MYIYTLVPCERAQNVWQLAQNHGQNRATGYAVNVILVNESNATGKLSLLWQSTEN